MVNFRTHPHALPEMRTAYVTIARPVPCFNPEVCRPVGIPYDRPGTKFGFEACQAAQTSLRFTCTTCPEPTKTRAATYAEAATCLRPQHLKAARFPASRWA